MIPGYLPRQRRTLVPKFKAWHGTELAKARQTGTIFAATDPDGTEMLFRLKSDIAADGHLNIEKIHLDTPPHKNPDTKQKISTNQIIRCIGNWPDFPSVRTRRTNIKTRV